MVGSALSSAVMSPGRTWTAAREAQVLRYVNLAVELRGSWPRRRQGPRRERAGEQAETRTSVGSGVLSAGRGRAARGPGLLSVCALRGACPCRMRADPKCVMGSTLSLKGSGHPYDRRTQNDTQQRKWKCGAA